MRVFVAPTVTYATSTTIASSALPALPAQTLMQLWIAAGRDPHFAAQMAAIALAESAGIPNNINPTDNGGTQTSWGLWQISNGTHEAPTPAWANPYDNAQLAVAKFKAHGFEPWGTYGGANYLSELAAIESGNPSPAATAPSGTTTTTADPYSTVAELEALANQSLGLNNLGGLGPAIDAAASGISKTTGAIMGSFVTMQNIWNNFGAFVVGLALIFIGSLLLAMMWGEDIVRVIERNGQQVAKTAASVAEVIE